MTSFYTNVSQRGNYLYVRGFDENGDRYQSKHFYNPYIFIPSNKPTGYQSIHGQDVEPKSSTAYGT